MGATHIIPLCILAYYILKYVDWLFSPKERNPNLHIDRKVKYIYNEKELSQSFLSEYKAILYINKTKELSSWEIEHHYTSLVEMNVWTKVALDDKEWVYYPPDYLNAKSYLLDHCNYITSLN